jgi:hypothetical protein
VFLYLAPLFLSGCSACEGAFPVTPDATADASQVAADAALPCQREGSMDALEHAPECVGRCTEAANPKVLRVTLDALSPRVVHNGLGAVVARIKNVGPTPVTLCFRLEVSEPTGWDRVAGIAPQKPEPGKTEPGKTNECDHPRLPFPLRTFSPRDASVDEFKVGATVTCTRSVRAVLLPGRALTKTISWPAIRLPQAPRPWEDDAGHRFYPKVVPVPLAVGTYKVEAEIPFVDAPPELRQLATTIEVGAD